MSKEPAEYLKHILDECSYILYPTHSLSEDDFLHDETLKRAVSRSLEIIGEATKKVPPEFKAKWTSIEWKNMAGLRDRLIHDYMGINYAIIWDLLKNKIPYLNKQIIGIIERIDPL